MSLWTAWSIIGALFGVPLTLLWLWRHDPSKPESRQDLEDAYDHLRERHPDLDIGANLDRWRGMGHPR
jgi:hypothetical protein